MVAVGKIIRFDDVRGYGFIAPTEGGDDVFVHANDFGDRRHFVHPGMPVEFETEQGDRGLKVASVRILDAPPVPPVSAFERPAAVTGEPGSKTSNGEDDVMCDVLAPREYIGGVTEVLLEHVPSLTGAQIAQVRVQMMQHARSHGWVES